MIELLRPTRSPFSFYSSPGETEAWRTGRGGAVRSPVELPELPREGPGTDLSLSPEVEAAN